MAPKIEGLVGELGGAEQDGSRDSHNGAANIWRLSESAYHRGGAYEHHGDGNRAITPSYEWSRQADDEGDYTGEAGQDHHGSQTRIRVRRGPHGDC